MKNYTVLYNNILKETPKFGIPILASENRNDFGPRPYLSEYRRKMFTKHVKRSSKQYLQHIDITRETVRTPATKSGAIRKKKKQKSSLSHSNVFRQIKPQSENFCTEVQCYNSKVGPSFIVTPVDCEPTGLSTCSPLNDLSSKTAVIEAVSFIQLHHSLASQDNVSYFIYMRLKINSKKFYSYICTLFNVY